MLEMLQNLTWISKWGRKNISGQSKYEKKFTDDPEGKFDDANMFFASHDVCHLMK